MRKSATSRRAEDYCTHERLSLVGIVVRPRAGPHRGTVLLRARAGVAVDLAAKGDFGHFRGFPAHFGFLLCRPTGRARIVATASAARQAARGRCALLERVIFDICGIVSSRYFIGVAASAANSSTAQPRPEETEMSVSSAGAAVPAGLLDRERIVAGPRFNRWLVPPAALAIHLCIGMAYGFSRVLAADDPPAHRRRTPTAARRRASSRMLFTTTCNWTRAGRDRTSSRSSSPCSASRRRSGAAGWSTPGPRKAGLHRRAVLGRRTDARRHRRVHPPALAAVARLRRCSAASARDWATSRPVSTLIKWFPDRRGMATGFAIMGYGGGAMIGAPLAVWLMALLLRNGDVRAALPDTDASLGVIYFVVDVGGAFGFRVPPTGWRPGRLDARRRGSKAMITHAPRASEPGLEDAAVLADLGRAVPQRHRRHRRDLDGQPDAAGRVRRAT